MSHHCKTTAPVREIKRPFYYHYFSSVVNPEVGSGWNQEITISCTHLCPLSGLHGLRKHHVLPASFPFLSTQTHIVSIPFSVVPYKVYIPAHAWNKHRRPLVMTRGGLAIWHTMHCPSGFTPNVGWSAGGFLLDVCFFSQNWLAS